MGTKEPKAKNGKGTFSTDKNPFQRQAAQEPRCDLAGAQDLIRAIDLASRAGCAVMIGATRDGGAWVITVLDNLDRHKAYCHTEDELDVAVRVIIEMYEGRAQAF